MRPEEAGHERTGHGWCGRRAAGVLGAVAAALAAMAGPLLGGGAVRAAAIPGPDGRYVTYGTTVPAGQGERCDGATGELYVPLLVHGSGNDVGMTDCASGDALPGGPGDWAEGAVWAPGVVRYGDQDVMYCTASRAGSGQKCIGRAVSDSAYGPFGGPGEWACPPAGRWASVRCVSCRATIRARAAWTSSPPPTAPRGSCGTGGTAPCATP